MKEIYKDFTGEYKKEFYDILLPDGEIIKDCWPNAGYMIDINNPDNTKYGPGECKFKPSIK